MEFLPLEYWVITRYHDGLLIDGNSDGLLIGWSSDGLLIT
jgi:hypothetical protein